MNHLPGFSRKIILILSLVLALLMVVVSSMGLFTADFYTAEKLNWQAQALGQDWVDLLLIAPLLAISSILLYRNHQPAERIWGGVILYCLYTFVIYCFDIHFNKLFIIYCICLGVSFYLFVYFLLTRMTFQDGKNINSGITVRVIGIYFIFISVLFYSLWLSEILPALMTDATPGSLKESGLPTNPVHVLDLAVVLPALFITGRWIMAGKPWGLFLAPVFLTFFILMDITIGTLVVFMKYRGMDGNRAVTLFMVLLAVFSGALLIAYFKPNSAAHELNQ